MTKNYTSKMRKEEPYRVSITDKQGDYKGIFRFKNKAEADAFARKHNASVNHNIKQKIKKRRSSGNSFGNIFGGRSRGGLFY